MKVSTHWFGFVAIGLAFQLFTCATVWFLPESPIWLLKKGKYVELRAALEKIADWNGTQLNWEALDLTEDEVVETGRPKAENVLKIANLP